MSWPVGSSAAARGYDAWLLAQADAYYGEEAPGCCQPYCPNDPVYEDADSAWWCGSCWEAYQEDDVDARTVRHGR